MSSDPTLDLLARFDDRTQWDRVMENVPIFVPHRKMMRDDKGVEREVIVTEADVHAVAANINSKERTAGVIIPWFEGHRLKGKPQNEQPQLLAYSKGGTFGFWGPERKPGLLTTLYIPKGNLEKVKQYPFRSAEYYPSTHELTAVAFSKSDPMLDMGMLAYQVKEGCLFYAMDENAISPEAMAGDPAAGIANDPTMPPQPPEAESEQYNAFKVMLTKAMAECYPGIDKAMQQYAAGGPAMPGPTNGAIPMAAETEKAKPAEPASDKKDYSQTEEALRYARLEGEIQSLKEANQATQLQYAREHASRVIAELEGAGYRFKDKNREIEKLARMDDAGRKERVEEIAQNYQRSPVGAVAYDRDGQPVNYLPTLPGIPGSEADATREPNERELEKALDYTRDNPKVDFDTALQYIRTGKMPVKA